MANSNPTPSRSQVDRLSRVQAKTALEAQRELTRTFETILAMPGGPAEQRDALLDLVPALVRKYGNVESVAAADWYDKMRRKWFKDEDYTASSTYDVDDVPIRQTVRRLAGHLWDNERTGEKADPDVLLRGLRANVDRWVKAGGRATIGKAVRNDPRGARYARVPQGPSCGFCIMLASRGYVYLSAESAGADAQWHNDCDCEVAVSWDGKEPHIEGYDHEAMYQRYLACRDTVEGQLTEDRYQTTYVDRFVPKYEGDEPIKFNQWVAWQISAEMDTRDRQWLFDGTVPDWTKEDGAEPSPKEIAVAEWMSRNGFRVRFRKTRSLEELRTSDMFIDDGGSLTPWEIKQPTGGGGQTIYHQMEEAAGQASHLIIDISQIQQTERWGDLDRIIADVSKRIRYHYKIKDGSEMQYAEVLLASPEKLIRIKRM